MGTKAVEIDENSDIIIDGVKYDGITGLWALVMMNDPPESSYTQNDLHMYKDLVYQTNVMSHPHKVVLGKSRYKKTKNWMHIFPLLKTLPSAEDDNANHDDDDNDDAAFEDSSQHASWLNKNNDGVGIQFLPGDKKGLEIKLNYLLAEYRVGKSSSLTRNKIVSILDEFLRRKRISRKEYRDINTFLLRSRGSCDSGLGRYSGLGMLDAIGRQLFSSGFKKAISSGVNSDITHKIVDAVMNGATSTSKGWKSCCKRCHPKHRMVC